MNIFQGNKEIVLNTALASATIWLLRYRLFVFICVLFSHVVRMLSGIGASGRATSGDAGRVVISTVLARMTVGMVLPIMVHVLVLLVLVSCWWMDTA